MNRCRGVLIQGSLRSLRRRSLKLLRRARQPRLSTTRPSCQLSRRFGPLQLPLSKKSRCPGPPHRPRTCRNRHRLRMSRMVNRVHRRCRIRLQTPSQQYRRSSGRPSPPSMPRPRRQRNLCRGRPPLRARHRPSSRHCPGRRRRTQNLLKRHQHSQLWRPLPCPRRTSPGRLRQHHQHLRRRARRRPNLRRPLRRHRRFWRARPRLPGLSLEISSAETLREPCLRRRNPPSAW